jgi:hypothetical protein
MGELLEPRGWCRQRWCRAGEARSRCSHASAAGEAEHFAGDGCSCHADGLAAGADDADRETDATPAADFARVLRDAAAAAGPRLTVLTAKASRLAAFACRACGRPSRRMIEAPAMFFRCEECASADRWPPRWKEA